MKYKYCHYILTSNDNKKDKPCVLILLRVKTSFRSINLLATEVSSGEASADADDFFFF